MTAPAPCRHMYSMTLRNGDRVCRRCDDMKPTSKRTPIEGEL